jgi:glucose-6-phosphate 1-dehydrogenase
MKLDIVIFGGTGDLSLRKLLPSLYYLFRQKNLPDECRIMCISRAKYAHDKFLTLVKEKMKEFLKDDFDEDIWQNFKILLLYRDINLEKEKDWYKLTDLLAIKDEQTDRSIIYYMSVAPSLF